MKILDIHVMAILHDLIFMAAGYSIALKGTQKIYGWLVVLLLFVGLLAYRDLAS